VSIIVRKAGILNTVQDLGRYGYQKYGVNPNGAMDRWAVRILNCLLGNAADSPVIEMHFPAGEFEFDRDSIFAVGGADFGPRLSGTAISNWTSHSAGAGDTLTFSGKHFGERAYLSVSGGISLGLWLGSTSTNLGAKAGGYHGRRLGAGDQLEWMSSDWPVGLTVGRSMIPRYSLSPVVRITKGPEFDILTGISASSLISEAFAISTDSNRMGFRMSGPELFRYSSSEMISSATTFGTIQLLPNGQLIILMADHQTTGGYPRIANVVEADLPLLAQIGPGKGVRFELVDHLRAEHLLIDLERELAFLRTGIRLKTATKL